MSAGRGRRERHGEAVGAGKGAVGGTPVGVGRLTLVGIALVVVAMVLVPAWGLFHKPARFGWQMYASAGLVPEFTLVRSGGRHDRVRLSDFVANKRPEVSYEDHLPPLLCERIDDVRYVLATRESPELDIRYPCRSA